MYAIPYKKNLTQLLFWLNIKTFCMQSYLMIYNRRRGQICEIDNTKHNVYAKYITNGTQPPRDVCYN